MPNIIKNSKLGDTWMVTGTLLSTPPEDFLGVNEKTDIKISTNNSSLCDFESANLDGFKNHLKSNYLKMLQIAHPKVFLKLSNFLKQMDAGKMFAMIPISYPMSKISVL